MTISCSGILRIRNDSDRNCIENQNTYFMFNNLFSGHRAVYEVLGKCGRVWQATDDNTAHAVLILNN